MKLVVDRQQRRQVSHSSLQECINVIIYSGLYCFQKIKDLLRHLCWRWRVSRYSKRSDSTDMNVYAALLTVITGPEEFSYCLCTQESFQDEFWQVFVDFSPSQRKFDGPVPAQSSVWERKINKHIVLSVIMGKYCRISVLEVSRKWLLLRTMKS